MSHFTVLVIGDDVDSAMEPYQENNFGTTKEEYLVTETEEDGTEFTYNPNSFYDYYTPGGRWQGMILTKDGENVNSARKGNIDFDRMYKETEEKAIERYDMAMNIFGELPPHKTMRELTDEIKGPDEHYAAYETKQTARKIWKAQPRVIAFETALESGVIERFKLFPDDYTIPKKEYVDNCKMNRFSTFGILTQGEYYCNDSMPPEEYRILFKQLLDNAGDDELITILDCHV